LAWLSSLLLTEKLAPPTDRYHSHSGNLAGFDISSIDSVSEGYCLSDRTTGSVDVIDAEHDKYLFST
jgi:hypothetical protein